MIAHTCNPNIQEIKAACRKSEASLGTPGQSKPESDSAKKTNYRSFPNFSSETQNSKPTGGISKPSRLQSNFTSTDSPHRWKSYYPETITIAFFHLPMFNSIKEARMGQWVSSLSREMHLLQSQLTWVGFPQSIQDVRREPASPPWIPQVCNMHASIHTPINKCLKG